MIAPRRPLAHPLIPDTERSGGWEARAACLKADPELFYPPDEEGRGGGGGWSPNPALAICATCTVILECREAANQREGQAEARVQGVWGNESPGARLSRRRRVRRASA